MKIKIMKHAWWVSVLAVINICDSVPGTQEQHLDSLGTRHTRGALKCTQAKCTHTAKYVFVLEGRPGN